MLTTIQKERTDHPRQMSGALIGIALLIRNVTTAWQRKAEQLEQPMTSNDARTESEEPKKKKMQPKAKFFRRRTLAEQTDVTFASHF